MNTDLTKQIMELEKNNDRLKIEKLLEDKLRDDPENIDLLFRLVMLNFRAPIVDYPSCCLLLEKIISISQKQSCIAKLIISCFKDREFGFIYKRAIAWFYEGKNLKLINNHIKKIIDPIIEYGICKNGHEETKFFLKNELKSKANNIEILFLLAIIEGSNPEENKYKALNLFEKIIILSKETESLAIIFFAYIRNLSYIDEDLFNRLNNLHTNNPETNSMIKYAISWFYHYKGNNQLEEKALKESIEYCQSHVWNYVHLARLYAKQKQKTMAEELIQKARSNVQKIYSGNNFENYDSTDLNQILNELIKGTYVTDMSLIKV